MSKKFIKMQGKHIKIRYGDVVHLGVIVLSAFQGTNQEFCGGRELINRK
ncbi:MAG: hypothetical protein V7K97_19025 [Nostoc sp.]